METLQEKFNRNSTENFSLSPGEYEGPLVITRPCTIDGNMSTIWCNQSPVISVRSARVTIKNLRLELLGEHEKHEVSLETEFEDVKFYNVEVNHGVSGLPGEADDELLSTFSLGTFAADEINEFSLVLKLSSPAEIENRLQDVEVRPSRLEKGVNQVTIITKKLRDNTILYGSLLIKTSLIHRINLLGKASKDAAVHPAENVYLPPKVKDEAVPKPVPSPPVSEIRKTVVTRGQRLPLNQSKVDVEILFHKDGTADDLDCYVFSLPEGGKVGADEDVVFFGNRTSPCSDVSLRSDSKGATFDLSKTQERIRKYSVCFSFCGDGTAENFSKISEPKILVVCGREAYLFPMENLMREKTIVGIEIYRHKEGWKINFIGAGFLYGAKELCEGYGVAVE